MLRFLYLRMNGISREQGGTGVNMSTIHIDYFKHPYAEFVLGSYQGQLCLCDFRYRKLRARVDQRLQRSLGAEYVEQTDEVIEAAKYQLTQYFMTELREFDLPLLLVGSDFQKSIWNALQQVAYGETSTYLELAQAIGNEAAVRAVGSANGANALAIIVPCHRIIGCQGELIGYGGGLPLKKRLLELESGLF